MFFYEINFWIRKNERTLSNKQEFENVTIHYTGPMIKKKEVANEVLQIYSIKNLNYIDDNTVANKSTIHNKSNYNPIKIFLWNLFYLTNLFLYD